MNDDAPQDHLDPLRTKLLQAALPHVPFDGWNRISLRKAASDSGISEGEMGMAFPGGTVDVVAYFAAQADRKMLESLAARNLDDMRVRERITAAVRARIEALEPDREAERRALLYLSLPPNAPRGLKCLAHTVDAMWRAAGDRSTDFNFYTKRGILAGVYTTTLACWLSDSSEGYADTWAFLDRRIDEVMQFEKLKAKCTERAEDMPSMSSVLRRLRYRGGLRMKP